jgi:hypothetical protein
MLQAIQKNVAWKAIPIAAISAGIVFLIVNMAITNWTQNIGPGLMLRYMASLILGQDALLSNDLMTFVMGLLVHFVLSFVFTFIITIVIHRWGMTVGLIGGGILGLCLYFINFYTMTLLFPWFFAISGLSWMVSHIAFGVVAGGVYERFDDYDEPFVKGGA